MAVRLSAAAAAAIRAAAANAYPDECCGLLVGFGDADDMTIERAVTSANVTTSDHRDSFEVDPKVRFDLMRELEIAMETETCPHRHIVGHYHSHPDHPAEPSDRDRAMAFEPAFVWLIASVIEGRVEDLRAHAVTDDGFRRLPLAVTPPAGGKESA